MPNANIGLRTGRESGLIALDVDPRHGGDDSLDELENKNGSLPSTVEALTGGGGRHLLFRYPDQGIRSCTKLAGLPGLDIKGDNSYIVGVGSKTTGEYVWEASSHPDDIVIAPMPEWLINLAIENQQQETLKDKDNTNWASTALQGVKAGERDNTCYRLACYFRRHLPEDIVLSILKDFAAKCIPPLDEKSVQKCVKSAWKHPIIEEKTSNSLFPVPSLPEEAWYGLFSDYRELVKDTTEAADTYHFASFALALGAVLARLIHVYHAKRLYPNFFITLVGKTGIARKDTAWNRAKEILSRLYCDVDPSDPVFQIIPGIGSAEGLIDALGGTRKVVVINESEFLSLLSKAKQEGLSNLIPKLTTLYDCPDLETLKTRQRAVQALEPFLSIISGTTQAWLQTALTTKEIYGGFANRFMFIPGEPKGPIPCPPKVNKKAQADLINNINNIRLWAQQLYQSSGGEIEVPLETMERFAIYYSEYHKRCNVEGLTANLIPRVQDFIWKFALLYAAIDYSERIHVNHLEAAIIAGDFLERSAMHIFQQFGNDKNRENELQLITYLRNNGKGPVARRDMYRQLRLSAGELERIEKSLIGLGLIKYVDARNDKGHKIRAIALTDHGGCDM